MHKPDVATLLETNWTFTFLAYEDYNCPVLCDSFGIDAKIFTPTLALSFRPF